MVLSDAEIVHLRTEGWVLARGVIPQVVGDAVQAEIEAIVDEAADKLHAAGRLPLLHRDLGWLHRLPALFVQCPEIKDIVYRNWGFPLPGARRPLAGKALFDLLTCPALLGIMAQLFSESEVFVSGVYRLRPKLPEEAEAAGIPKVWPGLEGLEPEPPTGVVPFHQDQCFFNPRSAAIPSGRDWGIQPPVITAWVPLMNATEETGCMQVMSPAQSVLHHHYLANVPAFAGSAPHTIHPDHFPDDGRQVTVPCKRGDVLLFSSYTPHRSMENRAGVMRWAADLRYNHPGADGDHPGAGTSLVEAGFLAASQKTPSHVVHNWREFVALRAASPRNQLVDKTSGSGNGEAEGKDRKKVPMDKDGRDLPAYHWKLAVDESFVQPLRQAQLEGRREFEGRLRLLGSTGKL